MSENTDNVQAAEPQKISRKEKKQLKKAEKKEKKLQKKIAKKERKKRWKETRKEDRRNLKEHYKDAPWFIRVPRLYFIPFLKICLLAGIVIAIGYGISRGLPYLKYVKAFLSSDRAVTQEEIYALSPYDTEGAERIAAFPSVDPDDTWTICVYVVGADLEDHDENDLSVTTRLQISNEREERKQASVDSSIGRLDRYSEDLKKNSLPLPEFLYFPQKPIAKSDYVMNEVVVTNSRGYASSDIEEMTMADLSDNITIVLQTGGATRWQNTFINPNKTQRFVINNENGFEEVANLPLQRASDPETLSDFLRFCKNEYPSDHTMLILWDHGGGPFGYGNDSIYGGDSMSMKDIRLALSNVYTPDIDNPAFDIIGFDACLMSSIEVTHALDGFASLYALSEEYIPGQGWNYTVFLNKMSEDPTMSPAAVAQAIADTYTDYYMTRNIQSNNVFGSNDVTFAVIDAKKASEVYSAYCELTKHQLIDAVNDISVLAEIGRCSANSAHVASDNYSSRNLVDLGCYVDLMVDSYPEECSKIAGLLDEAVLYTRQNGCVADTQGISVYIPGCIDSYLGLHYFLEYEYNICEDPYTRALYFYKMSGCLNDDMLETVKTLTDKTPILLDISRFSAYEKTMPVIENDTFYIPLPDTLQSMVQSYYFQLASYDETTGEIIYYGEDEYVYLDGEGNLCSDFKGDWVFMDGEPLALEITSQTLSRVVYRSHVLYNGNDAYLVFSFDRDTEEFEIVGIRLFPDDGDQINFMVSKDNNICLQEKDTIVPVYPTTDAAGMTSEKKGNMIKYKATTSIEMKPLNNGYYLAMANISDQRGDSYSSIVVGYTISGGKIKNCEVDESFIASDY